MLCVVSELSVAFFTNLPDRGTILPWPILTQEVHQTAYQHDEDKFDSFSVCMGMPGASQFAREGLSKGSTDCRFEQFWLGHVTPVVDLVAGSHSTRPTTSPVVSPHTKRRLRSLPSHEKTNDFEVPLLDSQGILQQRVHNVAYLAWTGSSFRETGG